MRKWQTVAVVSALVAGVLLTGCGTVQTSPTVGKNAKLKVVTTFYPLYEFSKQIAGDEADITMLIPSGAEPHDWEPTPQDVARIADANVFVYNGGGIEPWVDSVVRAVNEPNLHVVEAGKSVHFVQGGDEQSVIGLKQTEQLDPHIWLDPVLAEQEVQTIAAAFEQADPQHAEAFKRNADTYLKKLQDLDRLYAKTLQDKQGREFVTSHAAFGYMAKQYHITQLPIAGLNPDQEPSAEEMADIVTWAKAHQVKTIFFETLVSPKVAQAVAGEIGAKTAVLDPLEGLTEEEKAQGLDYIAVMKRNLEALNKALSE